MLYGKENYDWRFWIGAGMTFYGICYFIFHDVIVHRRFGHKILLKNKYLSRITRAHKIHHKNIGVKEGEAFGFLFANKKYRVKRQVIKEEAKNYTGSGQPVPRIKKSSVQLP
jgi:beta-carotene 3-hydroxylase